MKWLYFGAALFIASGCNNEVKLIFSPDKSHCISQYDVRDNDGNYFTIFSYGKKRDTHLPKSYIKVENKWRDAWYGMINWQGEKAVLLYTYHNFEAVNLDTLRLDLVEIKSDEKFFNLFFDKVPNNYTKVSSIKQFNK